MKLVARVLHNESVEIPGRANHAAAALRGDRLIICGGEDDDVALGDTWIGKVRPESVGWQRVGEGSQFEPR